MPVHPVMPAQAITLPLLPLRDVVVFPHMTVPLFIGRGSYIEAIERSMLGHRQVMLVAQRGGGLDPATSEGLCAVGCIARVLEIRKLRDGVAKVTFQGLQRARILSVHTDGQQLMGETAPLPAADAASPKTEALRFTVARQLVRYAQVNARLPLSLSNTVAAMHDAEDLADAIAPHLPVPLEARQSLLDMPEVEQRLERLQATLAALLREQAEAAQAGPHANPRPHQRRA